jgi:hypothetical protein
MAANLASGIYETAASLGMDPLDLATIISYETGGTFDPTKAGPTTQWGQHRGLIQFGEPQAQEYGVDWQNPVASQLGADGAVAKYFRQNGWQDGMSMLDAYSIVNAGGPGRYSASDANNGGAAGTVADKVRDQMGGHRQNAERLLGQQGGDESAQQGATAPSYGTTAASNGFQAPTWPQGQPMAQQAPQNALAQMQPPRYENALNVADFLRPVQANALSRGIING